MVLLFSHHQARFSDVPVDCYFAFWNLGLPGFRSHRSHGGRAPLPAASRPTTSFHVALSGLLIVLPNHQLSHTQLWALFSVPAIANLCQGIWFILVHGWGGGRVWLNGFLTICDTFYHLWAAEREGARDIPPPKSGSSPQAAHRLEGKNQAWTLPSLSKNYAPRAHL